VSWPTLISPGTVTITPDGRVSSVGYEVEHCSCRDASVLNMTWAIGKLQAAIMEDLTQDMPVLSGVG
jgi:hypothetical protein